MRCCLVLLLMLVAAPVGAAESTVKTLPSSAFSFDMTLKLPGTPDVIFDAITGDVTGWWDHTFSKPPKQLVLEPRVGGAFLEVFDDQGNGVRHAEVTFVKRPSLIRFEGPLGLTGNALHMVHTYEFAAAGKDSTTLTLRVQGSGHVAEGWPQVIEGVWRHFLIERFQPYIESGQYKTKSAR